MNYAWVPCAVNTHDSQFIKNKRMDATFAFHSSVTILFCSEQPIAGIA